MGGDQRRAGGTAPGQLTAAPRFRPRGQDDLAPSGSVARVRANLAALATLRAIEREDRPAAPEEQAVLARWSGWGAVPEVFDEGKPEFAWAREELSRLATPGELSAAARNTLNAHYTDAALVQAIWTGVQQLGFAGGRVLEAGCGSGNFIGFAPRGARVTGVELDPVTASIAAKLYPDADIANESFADTRAPEGSFDLAIGNVPFGNFALTDGRHNPGGHSIHNHFIIKSLHLVRPGGLVAVVTSRYTMDARNPAARREIAALADLAGAVRLPSGAHQQAAGTKVITDLLIFRRREPGRDPDATAWEQTRIAELDGVQVPVNEYFLANPGAVLGEMRVTRGAYSAEDLVVAASGDTTAALARALARIADAAPARGLAWTAAPDQARAGGDRARGPITRTATWKRTATAPSPRSPRGTPSRSRSPAPRPPSCGTCSGSATRSPACWTPRRHPGRTPPSWTRCAATSTGATTTTCGPTARSTGSPGGPPAAPTRTRAGRNWPASARRRAASAPTRSPPWSRRWRNSTRSARPPPRPRSSPAASSPPATPAWAPTTAPTRWRSAWTSSARSGWTPSPGCSAPTRSSARRELGTLVFDDPGTGRLIPAAEYLSGKVRDKLEAAERAAADDPRYDVNAEELRKVIPADLMPSEIDARLGASWIDASYVRDFLAEILADPGVRVEHPGGQVWTVRGNRDTVLATSTWGTSRYPATSLAQAILEQRRIEVRDKHGGRVLGPEHGRHPRRPGKSRRAGRAVPRMGLGRPGPRREAGRRLQPAVQRRRPALLRRRVAVAARPGPELRAPPAPGRRRRPDHPRARRRAVPRGRRRENRRDDHGRDGTAPPQAGQQALPSWSPTTCWSSSAASSSSSTPRPRSWSPSAKTSRPTGAASSPPAARPATGTPSSCPGRRSSGSP